MFWEIFLLAARLIFLAFPEGGLFSCIVCFSDFLKCAQAWCVVGRMIFWLPNISMPQEYRDGISKSLHSQAGAGRERQLRYNAAGRLSEKLDGAWLSRDRVLYYLALKPWELPPTMMIAIGWHEKIQNVPQVDAECREKWACSKARGAWIWARVFKGRREKAIGAILSIREVSKVQGRCCWYSWDLISAIWISRVSHWCGHGCEERVWTSDFWTYRSKRCMGWIFDSLLFFLCDTVYRKMVFRSFLFFPQVKWGRFFCLCHKNQCRIGKWNKWGLDSR